MNETNKLSIKITWNQNKCSLILLLTPMHKVTNVKNNNFFVCSSIFNTNYVLLICSLFSKLQLIILTRIWNEWNAKSRHLSVLVASFAVRCRYNDSIVNFMKLLNYFSDILNIEEIKKEINLLKFEILFYEYCNFDRTPIENEQWIHNN